MNRYLRSMMSVIVLLSAGLACNLPGLTPDEPESRPEVTIASPADNQTLEPNREVQIRSVAIDELDGIVRVELLVNGQVIWVDANAQPEPNTPFIVAQPWTPADPGSYMVQVRAYNTGNIAGESSPLTLEVRESQADEAPAANPTRSAVVIAVEPAATATATPTPIQPPAATGTQEATATATPSPTITLTPTSTPAPRRFSPTGLEPDGRFQDIWFELGEGDSRLGYPITPEITGRDYARQRFETGLMFWWDNPESPDYIWVVDSPAPNLKSGATSNRYPDTWTEEDGPISCDAAQKRGPVRGFGKVWCQHPELKERLGYPIEQEAGSGGVPPYARLQFFQGGLMMYVPNYDEVFVLFAQGDWQRFPY